MTEPSSIPLSTLESTLHDPKAFRLLLGLAEAAAELLNPNLQTALERMVIAIGKLSGLDRAYVFRMDHALNATFCIAEYNGPGIPSIVATMGAGPYCNIEYAEVLDPLLAGQIYSSPIREKTGSNLALNKAVRNKSDVFVPIFVQECFWGMMGFDDCEEERHFSESEKAVLRCLASMIASTIQREANERQWREAWQQAQTERETISSERAERIAAQNAVLRNSAARLSSAADFRDVIASSLAEMATVLGASAAHLFFYEDRCDTLSLGLAWRGGVISQDVDPSEPEIFGQRIDPGVTPGFARLCESRRYFSLSKGEFEGLEWPGVRTWLTNQGLKQAVALALMIGDRPLGVLGFVFSREDDLSEQQGELLYALAAQIALALEFNRLAASMRELAVEREQEAASLLRASELRRTNEALLRCTELLAEESDLHPFLCALMREATALSGAKSAGVFSYDEHSNTLRMESFMTDGQPLSIPEDPRMEIWRVPMPKSISIEWVNELRQHGSGRITFAAEASLGADHPWTISEEWHRRMGHREVITVPLYAGGRMIGTFGQCFAQPQDEELVDLNKTRLFASAAAVALQIARLSREARLAALEGAVLAERNRIARDLHDTLAQGFTGVLAQLGAAEGALELAQPSQVLHCIERARTLARNSLAEARSSVHALRLDTHGRPVSDRLRDMLGAMTEGTKLTATLEEYGQASSLSPVAEWCVHKFAQETLANTVKHSGADNFHLQISWSEQGLTVQATDDGIGFDHQLQGRGIGLALMRERASEAGGTVVCQHGRNGGACLSLEIPLAQISSL